MSTSLITLNENDIVELALNIMDWKQLKHLPVINNSGKLKGILTLKHIENLKQKGNYKGNLLIKEAMISDVNTCNPECDIKVAISLMKDKEIGSLPVIQNDELVGIVTIADLLEFDND